MTYQHSMSLRNKIAKYDIGFKKNNNNIQHIITEHIAGIFEENSIPIAVVQITANPMILVFTSIDDATYISDASYKIIVSDSKITVIENLPQSKRQSDGQRGGFEIHYFDRQFDNVFNTTIESIINKVANA